MKKLILIIGLVAICGSTAQAQAPRKPGWSNDQSPVQRDQMVVEALLPGTYDNHEQVYFDDRLGMPASERHRRVHTEIRRLADEHFGPRAYLVQIWRDDDAAQQESRVYRVFSDESANAVRLERSDFVGVDPAQLRNAHENPALLAAVPPDRLARNPGCDLFLTRIVAGFVGRTKPRSCVREQRGPKQYEDTEIMLGEKTLWAATTTHALRENKAPVVVPVTPSRMNRARWFTCSLSLGEGPDAKRFTGLTLMDQGGLVWVPVPTADHPDREVGLHLRNVDWAMNNSKTAFTNNVFAFYLEERWSGQPRRHIMYSYQAADAERAGINLLYMQAYCVLKEVARSNPRL